MGVLFPVLALTGCALAMDAPISAPVTGSHSAGPTSAPQITVNARSPAGDTDDTQVAGSGRF